VVSLPVGNAGNITAWWRGFTRYATAGRIGSEGRPRMFGFQAEGAAPIVNGAPVERPETVATAIRIGDPASHDRAVQAIRETDGVVLAVSDAEILEAKAAVDACGVGCEPASAASVAGLLHLHAEGRLPARATVVCILTGHGLKDPEWAIAGAAQPVVVAPDAAAVAAELGL
jgi:threonine synthase